MKVRYEDFKFRIDILTSGYLVLCGALFNVLAITTNGGRMPVLYDYRFDKEIHFGVLSCDEVLYCILIDRFEIRGLIFSLGDFVILTGVAITSYLIIYKIINNIIFRRRFKKMKQEKRF